MNFLFVVAHVDDAELSCGGTIAKLREDQTNNIVVLSLSRIYDGEDLTDEFAASMQNLNVGNYACNFETRRFTSNQDNIRDVIYGHTRWADTVFTHDCNDRHDDHRVVAEQVCRVYNGNIYTFITPINGNENPNYFITLTEQQVEKKIESLKCYKSQANRNYMNDDFILGWMRYNGIKANCKYAEAFRILRRLE